MTGGGGVGEVGGGERYIFLLGKSRCKGDLSHIQEKSVHKYGTIPICLQQAAKVLLTT